jgi:hypothetical protein
VELNEIEREADRLASHLLHSQTGKNEALLLGVKLEGLAHLAQIKRTRDLRAEWNAHVEMRETEIDAMHKAANAAEAAASWKAQEADEARRPKCGYRWSWREGDAQHWEICTLIERHELQGIPRHYNQVTLVAEESPESDKYCGAKHPTLNYLCTKGAPHGGQHGHAGVFWSDLPEPTKPAVDRLHELVSYLITESERAHDLAGQNQIGGMDASADRFSAVSKAYDDAATKLQEILQEGGL